MDRSFWVPFLALLVVGTPIAVWVGASAPDWLTPAPLVSVSPTPIPGPTVVFRQRTYPPAPQETNWGPRRPAPSRPPRQGPPQTTTRPRTTKAPSPRVTVTPTPAVSSSIPAAPTTGPGTPSPSPTE